MSEFERHLRDVAAEIPHLSVASAIAFAEARVVGKDAPLPNPTDRAALALWGSQQAAVVACLPFKPINAIKELRAAGWESGVQIGLKEAKDAIDVLRTHMREETTDGAE